MQTSQTSRDTRFANPADDALRASYDAVPYETKPISSSDLARLAAIARLHGLSPASPDSCRVLELGCAAGGNIASWAFRHPRSTFHGIDLSDVQIDDGRRTAQAMSLANVVLETRSITDLGPRDGEFDYIVCHGVYSWVPDDVRTAILRVCDECLSPNGIAYISFNTYPGWNARMIARQMMRSHDDQSLSPVERIARARAYVEALAEHAARNPGPYADTLQNELAMLKAQPDPVIIHEQLADFNEPTLVSSFIRRAAQHSLRYVADARSPRSQLPDPDALGVASDDDVIQREQDLDFILGQTFRAALLCRSHLSVDTSAARDTVQQLFVTMRAAPVESGDAEPGTRVFRAPEGYRLGTASPVLLAVFEKLWDAVPAAVAVADLAMVVRQRLGDIGALTIDAEQDINQLPALLLRIGRAGMVGFSTSPGSFTTTIGDRPTASALARWQASQGTFIADMRHAAVKLPPVAVFLLPYLDGTRDRGQLVAETERALDDGRLSASTRPTTAELAALVDETLQGIAAAALLTT